MSTARRSVSDSEIRKYEAFKASLSQSGVQRGMSSTQGIVNWGAAPSPAGAPASSSSSSSGAVPGAGTPGNFDTNEDDEDLYA